MIALIAWLMGCGAALLCGLAIHSGKYETAVVAALISMGHMMASAVCLGVDRLAARLEKRMGGRFA